jgi:hypothetical protein
MIRKVWTSNTSQKAPERNKSNVSSARATII